ncbi:MAG: peptidase family protein [Acidimicrobiia bacterium]|nr:peptidase family protein [Acidimicrobiia bacterium]
MEDGGHVVYRPGGAPEEGGDFVFKLPPPRRSKLARSVMILGRALIGSGLLVLGFVVYQLWGTGLQYSHSQDQLRAQFTREAGVVPAPATTTTIVRSTTTSAPVATTIPDPAATTAAPTTAAPPTTKPIDLTGLKEGDALALLRIPKIGVDDVVVAGVGRDDLKKGPGHYPETPLPGQQGNAAIAGHRTTFGAPFGRVDELKPGDDIEVSTRTGTYHYRVNALPKIISPNDFSVIANTPTPTLTLTSCHPRYSAKQRIVITADLVLNQSAPVAAATPHAYATSGAPADENDALTPTTTATNTTPGAVTAPTHSSSVDELAAGWFSDSGAWFPTLLFAFIGGALLTGAWYIGRRWSRVAIYLATAPLFIVALYFFYENVSRLLPPNL